jgi:hypothetical protein
MHGKGWATWLMSMTLGLLVLPTTASAALTLREGGATVPVGTKILATGDEEVIFRGGELSVTCTNNSMTGTVLKNNGTSTEWTIKSVKFAGTKSEERCDGGSLFGALRIRFPALTSEGGAGHWCMKNITNEDKFEMIGANCGTASGSFTMVFEGNISCTYTRFSAVTGTFTTTTGANPSTLSVTGEPAWTKEGGSFLCPAELKISKMKVTLSTDNEAKTPLQLDDVS